jgi:hypothetical protein
MIEIANRYAALNARISLKGIFLMETLNAMIPVIRIGAAKQSIAINGYKKIIF